MESLIKILQCLIKDPGGLIPRMTLNLKTVISYAIVGMDAVELLCKVWMVIDFLHDCRL